MKRSYYVFGILFTMLFVSMFIIYNNRITPISLEIAEKIALLQAKKDGYINAEIWNRFNTKTSERYFFSSKENKDIKVWQVDIDAIYNPLIKNAPAAAYFISKKDGSIVSVIKGLTQAGMDLELNGTKLNGKSYDFKIKNKGNVNYTIEWMEPLIHMKKQESNYDGEVSKLEINKIILVNTELSVSNIKINGLEQPDASKDIVYGFKIKAKEENEPFLLIDNYYRNITNISDK
ncbi:hypothetical protein [Bacillus sp. FJAT-28004]|uniref:hypothetical protein n=1 Tax=Bacillus sp. FJAT-28004 TaxID=1679165 RepID=UPI0006B4EB84|nr:hypothetical protein [Bacillus sp. FJAT-28004]